MHIKYIRRRTLLTESARPFALNESAKDKRVKKYLESRGYSDYNKQMEITGRLQHDIPNIRLDKGKFLLGVCRMYCDGELRNEQIITSVDNALKFIHAGGHTEEFDENLNGKSAGELNDMFREARKEQSSNDRARSADRKFTEKSNYRIIPIASYEEAKPYGKYTDWCVTHQMQAFKAYTKGGNRFYFCLQDGFESVRRDDAGAPINRYGLSMIAVNIDMNGDLTRVTTRYNHAFNGENNPALETAEQLEEVLNVPFYKTFKPYTKKELAKMGITSFDEVEELLASGAPFYEIFSDVYDINEGCYLVKLNNKQNIVDKCHKLLSPKQWFDRVGTEFHEGFDMVRINLKCNFIGLDGNILFPNQWFDACDNFKDGIARLELNGKWNIANTKGELLSPDRWFDSCSKVHDGFARITIGKKSNFINSSGKMLSPKQWFDNCGNFNEGYACVVLNGKVNYIDTACKLLSPNQWFDDGASFKNGQANVRLGDKWGFLNTDGNVKEWT